MSSYSWTGLFKFKLKLALFLEEWMRLKDGVWTVATGAYGGGFCIVFRAGVYISPYAGSILVISNNAGVRSGLWVKID